MNIIPLKKITRALVADQSVVFPDGRKISVSEKSRGRLLGALYFFENAAKFVEEGLVDEAPTEINWIDKRGEKVTLTPAEIKTVLARGMYWHHRVKIAEKAAIEAGEITEEITNLRNEIPDNLPAE